MFVRYKVKASIRERVVANFPDNVEALKYIVLKEQKKEKLTDEQAEKLKQDLEVNLIETAESGEIESVGKMIFLRDENGIYMTPRNIKGWLKETLKTLQVRGYREAVNHGVFVHPNKIYLMRGGEPIMEPDDEIVRPIQVVGKKGPRSGVKVAEVINAPCEFEFEVKIVDQIARKLLTQEVMGRAFIIGGEVGFLGDRSLQEGQADVEFQVIK